MVEWGSIAIVAAICFAAMLCFLILWVDTLKQRKIDKANLTKALQQNLETHKKLTGHIHQLVVHPHSQKTQALKLMYGTLFHNQSMIWKGEEEEDPKFDGILTQKESNAQEV